MTSKPKQDAFVFVLPDAIRQALSQESAAKGGGSSPIRIFIIIAALLAFGSITARFEAQAARRGQSAVPSLDIRAGCQYIANTELNKGPVPELGPGIKPGHDIDYPGCMAEERTAHAQLQRVWRTYTASQREQCLYAVTPPALPSYVTLQGCLDMARDAEKLIKSEPNTGLVIGPKLE
jgi:hypothetical protein